MKRAGFSFLTAWMIDCLAVGSVAAQTLTSIPGPPTTMQLFRFLADHVEG